MSPKKANCKAKSDSLSPSELATDDKKLMDLIDRVQDGDDGALTLLRTGFKTWPTPATGLNEL